MRTFSRASMMGLALAAAMALAAPASAQQATSAFALEPASRLWLAGTTNVRGWTCSARALTGAIDVDSTEDATVKGVPDDDGDSDDALTVGFPVSLLDCGRGAMTRSLQSALKAGRFPEIRFRLAGSSIHALGRDSVEVVARGRLSMAGESKPIVVKADVTRLPDGRFHVVGQKTLSMTAFGITPPTALLGLVKAADRVVVHFDVIVRSTTTLIATSDGAH